MSQILTLEDLLSEKMILEQTRYNIKILESLEELKEDMKHNILNQEEITEVIDDCIQFNMELWLYVSRLAEAQGIEIEEYQG